ncbi:MAG: Mur ligase family protein [Candidatus Kaiserbacteria bacterium]|nr:Mur ligase family protein [Candidatus Kaiserbacteria bacterium]
MQNFLKRLFFRNKKRAYFIGIAGAGMSGVAQLLKTKGWKVSGSDEGAYPPITTYLEKHDIPYAKTYTKDNVPKDADLIVVGKHAGLTKEENEEVAFVHEHNYHTQSFPDVLHDLTKQTHNIICAGSYGKSTCASILSWCLTEKDPSFFIGALPRNFDTNAQSGTGNLFILEGDEYPASNTDPRSKFLFYNAKDVLITSLEHDHVNVFKTQHDYNKPFLELIASMPNNGMLVLCGDDPEIKNVLPTLRRDVYTYSANEHTACDWYVKNIVYGEETTFDLCRKDIAIIPITTSLLGKHNIENIAGVAALILEQELITPKVFQEKIRTFTGVERRLDKKTNRSAIPLYEGFGSSAGKVRSAIAAMKTHFKDKRLLVLFEPYSFSWRRKDYAHSYKDLFAGADTVYVYTDGLSESDDAEVLSGNDIISLIKKEGGSGSERLRKDLDPLLQEISDGDVLLSLSSGSFDGLLPKIVEGLEKRPDQIEQT